MIKKLVLLLSMLILTVMWSVSAQNIGSAFGDVDRTGWVWVAWAWTDQGEGFLDVVKSFINWILWIMALIALWILLWWGFQMVTAAGNEDKYNKWFTILKQAAIWLIFMWVAWFVVSIIFTVIGLATG